SIWPVSSFSTGTPTAEIYTLSLHDALPIWANFLHAPCKVGATVRSVRTAPPLEEPPWPTSTPSCPTSGSRRPRRSARSTPARRRSEEHTSELQSRENLVCRLLLEKKNKTKR